MALSVTTIENYGGVAYVCVPFSDVALAAGASVVSEVIPIAQDNYSVTVSSFSGSGSLSLTMLIENEDPEENGEVPVGFGDIFSDVSEDGVYAFTAPAGAYRRLRLTNTGGSAAAGTITLASTGADRGEKGDKGKDGKTPELRVHYKYLQWNDGGVWRNLTSLDGVRQLPEFFDVAIEDGGTGASTVEGARVNLGLKSAATKAASVTPAANAVPVADANGKIDNWVPDASETVKGKVELATEQETIDGTSAVLATTPAGVTAAIDSLDFDSRVSDASETVKGKVELATEQEAIDGTSAVLATTPAGVTAAIDSIDFDARISDASEAVKGKAELATEQETIDGTSAVLATTPAGVTAAIDTRIAPEQEYQDVTGIRSLDTTYYNIRDYPYYVMVVVHDDGGSGTPTVDLLKDGQVTVTVSFHHDLNGESIFWSFMTYPGQGYRVNSVGCTLSQWVEAQAV